MKKIALIIEKITLWIHFILKRFIDEEVLLRWKPIHLCWWFKKHNHTVPKYFIGKSWPPTVVTGAASDRTDTSFVQAGEVTDDHGEDMDRRGFCYMVGTSGDPTTSNNTVSEVGGVGVYSLTIDNLTAETDYRVRAYATSTGGTGYGSTITVRTSDEPGTESTDFSEYTTGQEPDDWTHHWEYGTYEVVEDSFEHGGKALQHTQDSDQAHALGWDKLDNKIDVEIVGRMRTSNKYRYQNALEVRGKGTPGNHSNYFAELVGWDDGDVLEVGKNVSNTYSKIKDVSITYNADEWVWIRFRVHHNSLKAKFWRDSDSEPSEWAIEETDNSINTVGWHGVGGYSAVGTRQWDYVGFGIGGEEAPLPEVTDTLTIDDSAHIHEAQELTLTQAQSLVVNDSAHSHIAENIDLDYAEVFELVIASAIHSLVSEEPLLIQALTLAVNNSAHAPTSENVELTQGHNLVVQDSEHTVESEEPSLIQAQELETQDSAHLHIAEDVHLSSEHSLGLQDSEHGVVSDNIDLVQAYDLEVQDSTHSQVAESLNLSEAQSLTIGDTEHLHVADNIDFVAVVDLDINDTSHEIVSDNVDLVHFHTLTVDDVGHIHIADNLDLTQWHGLSIDDSSHLHIAEDIHLSSEHSLGLQDSEHGVVSENVELTQDHDLVTQDSEHSHEVDNVDLEHKHSLSVQDTEHTVESDNLDLTQDHDISIDDTAHINVADNIHLSQAGILGVSDSAHYHTAESLDLTQEHGLSVDDSTHLHTAEELNLAEAQSLVIDDAEHTHEAENIKFIEIHTLVISDTQHIHEADNIDIQIASLRLKINNTKHGRPIIIIVEDKEAIHLGGDYHEFL